MSNLPPRFEPSTIAPPARIPWRLRPLIWIAERMTKKPALPARVLAHAPKAALGAGLFELSAYSGAQLAKADGALLLVIARLVASQTAGCPFCVDMNAAAALRGTLAQAQIERLIANWRDAIFGLSVRAQLAAEYAHVLSATPVAVTETLLQRLQQHFTGREIVVLAHTVAQVNYWSRFNQGVGIPAAGFYADACAVPARS